MNERIKELAEQAGYHPDVFELCKPGMEKFAELIVKECKNVLLDMMDEAQGESDTLDQALTEINEHFGFDNE